MDELADQIAKFAWHLTHRSDSAENTVAAYDSDLRLFLKYLRAHVPAVAAWDDVRTSTVQHYMKFMRDEQRLKDTTVARRLFAVRSFFRFLRSQELVSSDPCADLSHSSPERRSPRILTGDEVERLLRQPANDPSPQGLRDLAIMETLYATGMRVSQLIALRLGDVDLASGTIRIVEGSGERLLLMNNRASLALRTYLERGRMQFLRDPNSSALFVNWRGQPLSRQGVWLIIKRYLPKAEIDGNVTATTLRHSFAQHQLAEGVNLSELQAMLGHSNPASTRSYVRRQAAGRRQAAEPET